MDKSVRPIAQRLAERMTPGYAGSVQTSDLGGGRLEVVHCRCNCIIPHMHPVPPTHPGFLGWFVSGAARPRPGWEAGPGASPWALRLGAAANAKF